MIGTTLGAYEIIAEVGKGAMATVYRAYQPSMERHVAVKVIHKAVSNDTQSMLRFQREAKLVARLEHPHILPVYDFDGTHPTPYIVMRLLENGTLRDLMRQRQLSLTETNLYIQQIAAAVGYAHRQGIIHRDIKPSNIMLDKDGNAFVTDFGVARMIEGEKGDTVTLTGGVVGTAAYMAPEQGLGQGDVDHRADIYALGVLLFRMATGEIPYSADNEVGIIIQHVNTPIPSARDHNPDLPPELDAVIARAMAKDPATRYQTATEFAAAVKKVLVGQPISAKRSTRQITATDTLLAEQRKIVTVMYATIDDYGDVISKKEGEEAARIATNALSTVFASVVSEHGGQVITRDKNALVALWGADTSREDDPERAIRAGLAMQDTLRDLGAAMLEDERMPLPMRIGINTGQVLLKPGGENDSLSASGPPLTIARRLMQKADRTILISHNTYRYVRGVFEFVAADSIRVSSQRQRLKVYQVVGAKPRTFFGNVGGVEGISTAMVGRDAELKYLQDSYSLAVEDHETQSVTVVGEAGMGKTRLLFEFITWVDLQPEHFLYFAGRATPEMTNRPYALLRNMLSYRFEIYDSDSPATVRTKMENGMATLLPDISRETAHFIGHLVGFDFSGSTYVTIHDPQELTRQAQHLVLQLVAILASQHPTIIELEDIHWADNASLDLLNDLIRTHDELMLVIVCSARPQLYERRPTWGSGVDTHSRLDLRPLSKRDTRLLVREVLQQADNIPKELRNMIVDSAEGNPYFVEELVKMLVEDHIIQKHDDTWTIHTDRLVNLPMPPTLAVLLQTRLDSLLVPEIVVLQRASVAGRVFWDDLVVALDNTDEIELPEVVPILDILVEHEFVFMRESSAFASHAEFIFASNMLRDVVYNTLLDHQRRIYHNAVAEWLLANSGDRAAEYAILIAEHYEQAGKTNKAADALYDSGKQAFQISAYREAVDFFSRAKALSTPTNEIRHAQLHACLAETHLELNTYTTAANHFEAGLAIFRHHLNDEGIARCLNGLGTVYRAYGDSHAAQRFHEESLTIFREINDEAGIGSALTNLGLVAHTHGDHTTEVEYYQESLIIYRELSHRLGVARTLNYLGMAERAQGEFDEAIRHLESGLSLFKEIGNRRGIANSYYGLGLAAQSQKRYPVALRYYNESLTIFHEVGNRWGIASCLHGLGFLSWKGDDLEVARQYYTESLGINREIGNRQGIAACLVGLGYATSERSVAEQHFHEALVEATTAGILPVALLALTGLAARHLQAGAYAKAARLLGLALHHSAANIDVQNAAMPLRETLPEDVQDAYEDGKTLELESTVKAILKND